LTIETNELLITPVQSLNTSGSPGEWALAWRQGLPDFEAQNYTVQYWNLGLQEWQDIANTTETELDTNSLSNYLRVQNHFRNYTNSLIALNPTPELRFNFQNNIISSGIKNTRLSATNVNYTNAMINNFTLSSYVIPEDGTSANILQVPSADIAYWNELLDADDPFTVAFWVEPGSGYEPWFGGYNGNDRTFRLDATRLGENTQLLRVEWRGSELQWPNVPSLSYDNWQHIALTYDGNGGNFANMRLYINGTLVPSDSNQAWGSVGANSFGIGGEPSGASTPCDGCSFVDVVVYGTALSAEQVVDLMEMRAWPAPRIPPPTPNELTFTNVGFTSVDLAWTESESDEVIVGYQINVTTPWGIPSIILENNTGNPLTEYEATGLQVGTQYSFRVKAWTTTQDSNPSNIINVRTLQQIGDIGDLPTNVTNTEEIDIQFRRQDIPNANATLISVSYPTTYDLNCEISYRFGNGSIPYTSLPKTILPNERAESVFRLENYENDIATLTCYNALDDTQSASYIITHTNVVIVDYIDKFRTGEYGTFGTIGALDLVGLMAVIVTQIGLNRKNEAAGVVIGALMLGILGFFGILSIPVLITGVIAVVVLFAVVTTRKN